MSFCSSSAQTMYASAHTLMQRPCILILAHVILPWKTQYCTPAPWLLGSNQHILSKPSICMAAVLGAAKLSAQRLMCRHEVVGVFMQNWDEAEEGEQCTSEQDLKSAAAVCQQLDIPLHQASFVTDYWHRQGSCCGLSFAVMPALLCAPDSGQTASCSCSSISNLPAPTLSLAFAAVHSNSPPALSACDLLPLIP